ncbi:MAG: hypothetical protein ABW252_17845 [Polyangiales bacterium]
MPTRRARPRFARVGATLQVLWLAAWPASHARADTARDVCMAAHVQGQELSLANDYAGARARFEVCSATRCPAVIRDDCASMLAGLDATLPTVVFEVATLDGRPVRDARVFVDGRLVSERTDGRSVALAPGAHAVRIEAEGRVPVLQQIEVAKGDRGRVVVVSMASAVVAASRTATAPSRHGRSLLPVYVLAGSGLAVLATGAVLGGLGLREENRLKEGYCRANDCSDDDTRKGRRLYVAADVAFGAGAALGVAALSLYFVQHFRRGEVEHARAPVNAHIDARGASLSYSASF